MAARRWMAIAAPFLSALGLAACSADVAPPLTDEGEQGAEAGDGKGSNSDTPSQTDATQPGDGDSKPGETEGPKRPPLQGVLDALGPKCAQLSPGTTCGLAVRDIDNGETASFQGNTVVISASSVKAVWVSVAMKDTSIEKVQPFVQKIFANSDNYASGDVIDLLSSPDRINTYMWNEVGMKDSGYCGWGFGGKPRKASNCKTNVASGNNFFTANDGALFMEAVAKGQLLGAEKTAQLLEWMKLSPRKGYGGWVGTQLPDAARATMAHKAGWLPPPDSASRTSNEIALIQVPNGHRYSVGLTMKGGNNYDGKQLPMMEYASCVIYHAVANDAADACKAP